VTAYITTKTQRNTKKREKLMNFSAVTLIFIIKIGALRGQIIPLAFAGFYRPLTHPTQILIPEKIGALRGNIIYLTFAEYF
jgi:hypothetical protein